MVAPPVNTMTPPGKAPLSAFRKINKHLHMPVYTLNILSRSVPRTWKTAVMAVAGLQQRFL
jgi:hypothetical protein